jgi:endonuclease/exonuclease/phosphatase family metal-dependent hydrolase
MAPATVRECEARDKIGPDIAGIARGEVEKSMQSGRATNQVVLSGIALVLVAFAACTESEEGSAHALQGATSDIVHLTQYNVQFLLPDGTPGFVFDAADHFPPSAERAAKIGAALACQDIVALNETSSNTGRRNIIAAMEANAAACGHQALVDGGTRFFDALDGPDNSQTSPVLDDEIALVSRFPIVMVHSMEYSDCSGIDCLAAKGALHARLWRGPGHPATDAIDVFVTHLNNGDATVLAKQVEQLAAFIQTHNDPQTPIVIMGDFNIAGNAGDIADPGSLYSIMMSKLDVVVPGPLHDLGLDAGPTNDDKNSRIDYMLVGGTGAPITPATTNYFEYQFRDIDDPDLPQDGRLSDHGAILGELRWDVPRLPPNPGVSLPRELRVRVSRLQEITADVPDVAVVSVLVPIPTPIGVFPVHVPVLVGCDGLTDHFGDLHLAAGDNSTSHNLDEDHTVEGDDITREPPWQAGLSVTAGVTEGSVSFSLSDDDDLICGGGNDQQDINPFSGAKGIALHLDFTADGVFVGTTRLARIGEPIFLAGTDSEDRARATLIIESRYSSTADSEGDGLVDADEAYEHGTDPLDADSDDDGLNDGAEVLVHGTDPLDADSDDDGLTDGAEVLLHGTNPLDADSDDDGLTDGAEVLLHGTNPLDADSDDDGLSDGAEVLVQGTNPLDADSDDDGLTDGAEVLVHGTNPLDADSDDDGLTDGTEIAASTDPLDADSDDDGIRDGEDVEFIANTVSVLPTSAFRTEGNRTALLTRIQAIEAQVARENRDGAIDALARLRTRLDGCSTAPDGDDWILDCVAQAAIRALLDTLAANLQS